jgi:dipeptidyl aminopeptidase/acylaminoacyl peptidase
MMRKRTVLIAATWLTIGLLAGIGNAGDRTPKIRLIEEDRYKTFYRIAGTELMNMQKPDAWKRAVPEVRTVSIPSTADGSEQPALFYDSGSDRKKPLLIVLHSWSADYRQQFSIPYGIWAVRNDWVFIHPDYRGPYDNPEATASESAIRDILDALYYAKRNANVDNARIYLSGFSGGGMTALIMAGRFPALWTGVVAWVPVYDLATWHATTRGSRHNYAEEIEASCGGAPLPGTPAEAECRKRSAGSYIRNARGKELEIYIATGIRDTFVPPDHSFRAFNDLAEEKDRIFERDIEYITSRREIPPHLAGDYSDPLYEDAGIDLLFERKSANATLKIFDSRHDMIYNAGLEWLSRQRK